MSVCESMIEEDIFRAGDRFCRLCQIEPVLKRYEARHRLSYTTVWSLTKSKCSIQHIGVMSTVLNH